MRSIPPSMQECQVCGLLFGGGARCPECKSIFGSAIEMDHDDALPSGPLPGTESLVEILPEVDGLSGPTSDESESRVGLPFTLGGARASPKVQLLFGAGTRSDLLFDESESSIGVVEDGEINQEVVEEITEEISNEDIIGHLETGLVVENDDLVVDNDDIEEDYHEESEIIEQDDEPLLLTSRPIISTDTEVSISEESEDVVYHDFSEETNFSEVEVDFDNLVDPAEAAAAFDPSQGDIRLVQLPARALSLSPPFNEGQHESMASAFDFMQKGEWVQAASLFMELCEQRPGDAPAINNHGLCLLQTALSEHRNNPIEDPAKLPHFHAAILTLRQAAMANRSSAQILVNLGTALGAADRHETALPIFEAAAALESESDSNRMNNHAVSLHALGRNVDAASMLEGAQSASPEDPIIAENVRVLTIAF